MTEHVPWRRAARFLGAVALAVVSLRALDSVVRIVVWRSHYKPALDLLRRYNKAVTNRPAALERAADRGKVTLVHHAGRRSGREYVTPVWGVRVGQSCYVQLPYGTRVDWCRNVLKAGGCTFDHDALRYHAVDRVIVPATQARPLLPPATQRMQRLIGAESYLRLDIDPGVTPSPPGRAETTRRRHRVADGVFTVATTTTASSSPATP